MPTVTREAQALPPIQRPNYLNYGNAIDATLSSGMASAQTTMRAVLDKADAIIARRALVDPRMTEGANLYAIERLADEFGDWATRRFDAAMKALKGSTADAATRLKAAVGVSPTANTRALQDRLASMTAKQRVEILGEAFASGDKELIGAVVDQHTLLHRCDAAMVAELFDRFQQKVAPNEYASLAAHQQAIEYLEKGHQFTMRFTARAYSGTEVAAAKRREIATILSSYGVDLEVPDTGGEAA